VHFVVDPDVKLLGLQTSWETETICPKAAPGDRITATVATTTLPRIVSLLMIARRRTDTARMQVSPLSSWRRKELRLRCFASPVKFQSKRPALRTAFPRCRSSRLESCGSSVKLHVGMTTDNHRRVDPFKGRQQAVFRCQAGENLIFISWRRMAKQHVA
jgi:hypothetical protein